MIEELKKFQQALDAKGIEWHDVSDYINDKWYINRIHFNIKSKKVSVINGFGTYGGFSLYDPNNKGLLEVMIGGNEPVGWLTCEEAIKLIFEEDA